LFENYKNFLEFLFLQLSIYRRFSRKNPYRQAFTTQSTGFLNQIQLYQQKSKTDITLNFLPKRRKTGIISDLNQVVPLERG